MTDIPQEKAVDPEGLGPRDRVKFWRSTEHDALECLAATFRTHRYAPHRHETYVIGVIERGCESFRLNGETLYAGAGTVCFVNPGEVHDGAPHGGGFAYRMTYPSLALVAEIAGEAVGCEQTSAPHFATAVVDDPAAYERFRMAHGRLEQSGGTLGADEALVDTYAMLIGRHSSLAGRIPAIGAEPRAVARTREILEARYAETIGLAELAAEAGLSRYHLIRVFRAHTGLTPHAYLTDVRVRAAQRLLRAGDPPAEVALACGFFDQSHLTRAFKARIGVPPAAFRGR